MKILVLSDLHIGTDEKFGLFGWTSDEFIQSLELISKKNGVDKIILNGDIFELDKYRFDAIKRVHPKLINLFSDKRFVLLKGNHDHISTIGNDSYDYTNTNGQTIHIEHGHNADFLNGTKIGRFLCRKGLNVLKFLVKWDFLLEIYYKIVEFDDEVDRIPKKYNSYKYLKYALKLLKSHDVVILGHTHKLEAHKTYYINRKKRYLNSGSCSLGRFQGLIIDTESLNYEIIKYNKSDILSNEQTLTIPLFAS
ncbi:MAG: metallophosphoesterase family protein [Candidatus Delongbacteria bacterium]|nr:metallophosphoesterase family protein [Candidatus Delongbacteria bacterium]MBN2836071.1 metallophosphoesterase family protein [Candidatus Delongbacteria bacterium]